MPEKRLLVLLITFLLITITSFSVGKLKDNDKILGTWDTITPAKSLTDTSVVTISPDKKKTDSHLADDFYTVIKVIDGDTITVSKDGVNQTIRLIGMNSPESVDPRKPVECFGKEAANKAREILSGKNVRLSFDPTQGDLDKYNRLLRYVFLENGILFNLQMIREGYAYEYTYNIPYQYQDEFISAQEEAKNNQIGLWNPAVCDQSEKEKAGFIDKDCNDFATQNEAFTFFLQEGGPQKDPHKLDSNHDGSVCESLP